MEQQFSGRRQQLEQEAASRRQQLEQEAQQLKRSHAEAHERDRQQGLQELAQIRNEAARLQQDSQAEAERLRQEALSFRQSTQQQAETLMLRSRQEAAAVQQGANRYAEQVFGELDQRLQEMTKQVIVGRRELVRLQSGDVETTPTAGVSDANGAVPISRARRAAGRLRSAVGRS
jgi:hypothetical protein